MERGRLLKRKGGWLIALACLGVVSFLQYEYRAPKRNFSDFHVTYTTGARFVRGEPIYTFEGGLSYFKYPPFYAFFMGPFSALSEHNAARLWHLLNLLFVCILFTTVRALLPEIGRDRRPFLYLLAGIASFRILLENLHEGQANLFMLTLLWGAIFFISQGKDIRGGFLLAFSILTKYFPILFFPVFLVEKKYKALLWTVVFLVMLTLLPALAVGMEKNNELLAACRAFLFESSLDDNSISTPPNQSLLAFLSRMIYAESHYGSHLLDLSRRTLFALYFLISGVLLLGCLGLLKKRRADPFGRAAVYGMACLCMSLLNPNAWRNAFLPITVAYLIAFAYLFRVEWKDKIVWGLTGISFCLISLPSEFLSGETGVDLSDLYSTVTLGTLFLFGALVRVWWGAAQAAGKEEVGFA